MENFKSKYFNLDSFYGDWERDELVPVLNFLESADVETLQKIVTECGVNFSGGNENVDDKEELVRVLFGHDVSKNKLLEILKSYM